MSTAYTNGLCSSFLYGQTVLCLLGIAIGRIRTEIFLKEIRDRGVDGVEVAHSGSTVTRQRYVEAIARRLNLLISGGSDFHGEGKPQAVLGRLSNGKPIPLSFLPDLLKEKSCQENGKKV